MPRKLFLSMLALLVALPVMAQIAPIRIPVTQPVMVEPVTVEPVTPPVTSVEPVMMPPADAPIFDITNDPEKARAYINKLRGEKRALREAMTVTLGDLQNARTTIDEMTRLGGTLVRAQCVSPTLSRTTAGVSENCAASGYTCGGVEGTCLRQCANTDQCSAGFICDIGVARCGVPPIGDVE